MPGAARGNKVKVDSMKMKPMEMPSTMSVNTKKHPVDSYELGEMISFSGKGKITSLNKDEYGETMRMEISKLSCKGGYDGGAKEEKE